MDGNIRINWQLVVEEAKQRRKSQRLTQSRLATLAGVSTPTVSRFESGEKDIQLSSALAILEQLGMTETRMLTFPEPDPRYHDYRNNVLFDGRDGDESVPCRIGRMALLAGFGFTGSDVMKGYEVNRAAIEHLARKKFALGLREPDGSVWLKREDLVH